MRQCFTKVVRFRRFSPTCRVSPATKCPGASRMASRMKYMAFFLGLLLRHGHAGTPRVLYMSLGLHQDRFRRPTPSSLDMGSIGLECFSPSLARVKPRAYVPNRASAPSSQLPNPSSWLVLLFLSRQNALPALAVPGMVDSVDIIVWMKWVEKVGMWCNSCLITKVCGGVKSKNAIWSNVSTTYPR